jgi:ATP sulfurylase
MLPTLSETSFISPFGGKLTNLMVEPNQRAEMLAYAVGLPSLLVSQRVGYDLELLATGAFSPLGPFHEQRPITSAP